MSQYYNDYVQRKHYKDRLHLLEMMRRDTHIIFLNTRIKFRPFI